ncbi:MAG: response regulator [Candidatus Poribacteria bacterium]|nr:response regulator [Candidatus Poribacteria bacterium]
MSAKRILVVEDIEMNRKVARIILAARGYEVLEAANAEEALEILRSQIPDLILMDIYLPGMSGKDLTRQIKANPKWNHLPIIALTASAMKGDREQFLDAGCDDYISKPVNTRELAELVDTYISKEKTDNE